MISKKAIKKFILKCVFVYVCLLALTTLGLDLLYSNGIKSLANKTAKPASYLGLDLQFKKNMESDQSKYDLEMVIMNKDTLDAYLAIARNNRNIRYIDVPTFKNAFSSTRQGLIPAILLIALIIATPIPLRWRKTSALFWGIILIHLFFGFKLFIWLLNTCQTFDQLGFAPADSFIGKQVIHYLNLTFFEDMPMRIIMPVLIWIMVCFRKTDFQNIRLKTFA